MSNQQRAFEPAEWTRLTSIEADLLETFAAQRLAAGISGVALCRAAAQLTARLMMDHARGIPFPLRLQVVGLAVVNEAERRGGPDASAFELQVVKR